MILSARVRAAKSGVPCTITEDDLTIPPRCPVLGIEWGTKQWVNSPSLDRIIPALGYVPGNVRVVSARANNLKKDASLAELEAVVNDLKSIQEVKLWQPPKAP
jgi:hypothetical protein